MEETTSWLDNLILDEWDDLGDNESIRADNIKNETCDDCMSLIDIHDHCPKCDH